MRTEFLTFLAEQGALPRHLLDRSKGSIRQAPEPIGSLAFLHGLIKSEDIDTILDEQRRSRRPFGQIAKDRGLLTDEQVRRLLTVQRLRSAAMVAESLILTGAAPTETVTRLLAAYMAKPEAAATAGASA